MTANLTHFVLHSIAMVEAGVSAGDGLRATKKFLSSLGRYFAAVRIEVAADHKFQVWTNSLPLVHVWDWRITTGLLQALCSLWR